MMKNSWLFTLLMMLLITFNAWSEDLKSGPWRFELKTENADIPFIVELSFQKNRVTGKLYNGKETIPLENIIYSQQKLRIPLQTYEITLELKQDSPTKLSGLWIRHNKDPKIEIPVEAVYGEKERFPNPKAEAKVDLNGRWSVELLDEQGQKSPGVIVFDHTANYFTGSILTATGDYRFMEGYVSGTRFEAASFDGMYNYVFKGEVIGDKINAAILSNYITKVNGKKDAKAELPDAYSATKVDQPLKFSFPDLKGKQVSLEDKRFKNKPVIVQFFGSWCPNCLDEMNYFIPWYQENKNRGIEIVALAFERSLSEADAKRQLIKVQKKKQSSLHAPRRGLNQRGQANGKDPGAKELHLLPDNGVSE